MIVDSSAPLALSRVRAAPLLGRFLLARLALQRYQRRWVNFLASAVRQLAREAALVQVYLLQWPQAKRAQVLLVVDLVLA